MKLVGLASLASLALLASACSPAQPERQGPTRAYPDFLIVAKTAPTAEQRLGSVTVLFAGSEREISVLRACYQSAVVGDILRQGCR